MLKTTTNINTSNNNNTNKNNLLKTFTNLCSPNKLKMETTPIKQLIKNKNIDKTTPETPSPPATALITNKLKNLDRRLSLTSESSVEPMDLGRTPTPPPIPTSSLIQSLSKTTINNNQKKLYKSKSQNDNENNNFEQQQQHHQLNKIKDGINTTPVRRTRSYSHNDDDDEQYDSEEQKQNNSNTKKLKNNNYNNSGKNNNNSNRYNSHYRHNRTTVVEIESNDNPNSLRKKFRISTSNKNNYNNNNITLDNNNKYCTNVDIDEHNNNENGDKRKLRTTNTNNKNKDKNSLTTATILKKSSPTSSTTSSSRNCSDDNDDNNSNSSNGAPSGDDDDINNRTSQNESGFVDGSSHNLIHSINSISSPEYGNGNINVDRNINNNNNLTSIDTNVIERECSNNNNSNNNNNTTINSNNNNNNNNEDIKFVCPICEVVSATPHEFTNHIRSHNYTSGDTENFTCRICSKVLSSASSLDRHVLVHTGERPFNCKYCHLTFTTNGNMHRHMRTHKQHPHQKRRSSNNNNNNNSNVKNNNNKDSNNLNVKINNINNNNLNTNVHNLNSNLTNDNGSINNNNNNNDNNNNSTILPPLNNSTKITQNGNIIGDGGESYESEDGGCSTDSSASNNSSNCKSNNIRNNNNNNNNNGINIINKQNAINNNNNYKRKSIDDESNGFIKKRMKTINNNTIINENDSLNDLTTLTLTKEINERKQQKQEIFELQQQQQQHQHQQQFCCPVCNLNDLTSMLSLTNHMDFEHSDIPAKCRQCDVVFKTHKQLNAHRCTLTKKPSQEQQQQQNQELNTIQNFKDLTLIDFSSEKFPLIAKSLSEQNIRRSIATANPKYECTKCYLTFPCINSLDIHKQECNVIEKKIKPVPHLIDPQALLLSNMLMHHPSTMGELPQDFSVRKIFNIQQLMQKQQQQDQEKQQKSEENIIEKEKLNLNNKNCNNDMLHVNHLLPIQVKRSLSSESLNSNKDDSIIITNNINHNNKHEEDEINRNRNEFFANLDLKNKSIMNFNANNINSNSSTKQTSEKILDFSSSLDDNKLLSSNSELNKSDSTSSLKQIEIDNQKDKREQKLQQHLQLNDSRDLADIQSILNVTASSSNFLRNFEANVNTPMGSECGYGKDEEEAQDSFTAEFRKMKLRGEFPCKLCNAVFPNLRALKGHNRIHISAAGNAGPFRCNMCLYSIHDKAALVRHMRTHNGDRPYECGVCNYAFTTKANCERHLRNRHAKTTRDEVKRSIIYHPSEDSSCDDPTKKLHLFSSSEFDNDDELQINPKDRSTPVSHLKEILQSETITKPSVKIQVKSLEKLIDKPASSTVTSVPSSLSAMPTNNFAPNLSQYDNDNLQLSNVNEKQQDLDESIDSQHTDTGGAIDLSMDVLDLSKKSKPILEENLSLPKQDVIPDALKLDLSQQWLLAQQQFLVEALPKMDPTNYFQFCRNLTLPMTFNPFLTAFNPLLSNGLVDFSKFSPFMNSAALFGNPANAIPGLNIPSAPNVNMDNLNNIQTQQITQESPQHIEKVTTDNHLKNISSTVTSSNSQTPKPRHSSPVTNIENPINVSGTQTLPQTQRLPMQQQLQTTTLNQSPNNNGPVKMVIKNGVLMPKQKQRRYRTERPFACEHCSARFTLRSNMERHIKQQHPVIWAQRQRSGQHVMRGRGNSSNVMSHMQSPHIRPQVSSTLPSNHYGTISEQVKYALLAQQLKARKETDILQQALTQGSNSSVYNNNSTHNNNGTLEDDDNDPKLIIDEDDELEEIDDQEEPDDEYEENENTNLEKEQYERINNLKIKDEFQKDEKSNRNISEKNLGAKKVAETILEQAIKAGSSSVNKKHSPSTTLNENGLKNINNTIINLETTSKFLKEESSDLASVSKLVDNATNNVITFNNYFKPNEINESTNNVNPMEQSDEEGLVASGSASDNNSGAEESTNNTASGEQKKKSAYSLAPNRVPCPYCDRIFPWSSSLRRHVLTHTGQKPFKCSHCPLLFTTKSNCDRHLLRKHGNVESAVSLYVPIDDMPDPVPMPKAVAEAMQAAKAAAASNNNSSQLPVQQQQLQQSQSQPKKLNDENQEIIKNLHQNSTLQQQSILPKLEQQTILQISSTDLPYKCHLCDSSFSERLQCLDHIKINHIQEFALLLAKGAIDTEIDVHNFAQIQHSTTEEDDKRDDGRGKYPDYANRKVICAFCIRRFWSTEDLRRHMRTHSGERPFQCEVCLRKFTLKHSMLRHMKKHNGGNHNNQMTTHNSGSDFSDDEQPSSTNMILANSLRNDKIHELLNKVGSNGSEWHNNNNNNINNRIQLNQESNNNEIKFENNNINNHNNNNNELNNSTSTSNANTDLIGNLLGISDQSLLNKFLTNPSEAAKFFGVEK